MDKVEYNSDYNILWSDLHSKIFSEFIVSLNKNRIRYIILRNFEGLPKINTSKDVDFIIEPGSYNASLSLLKSILKNNNISNFRIVKYEKVNCCFGIDVDKHFSIHIDLIEGYFSKGFELFPFDELYDQTIDYENFKVLNNIYNAVMLLFYKVISSKQLKSKYKNEISRAYSEYSPEINQIITDKMFNNDAEFIIKALKVNNYKAIIANSKLLSNSSKKKEFFNRPFYSLKNSFFFIIEKFYRIILCPRQFQNFISVQGADGTGKSTFIYKLVDAISYYYVDEKDKSHIYHHRPKLIPNIGEAGEKAGVMKEDKNFTNPHRALPSGFIISLLRMIYYWMDYLIGVPLKLRKDVQFDKFTIYDRYIYDFLIDPYRSRIKLPYWLRMLFTKLVIQPRLVFVLITDAETIFNRKQELTISEINRQLAEFKKLSATNKRFIVMDASKSVEELVDEAMRIIINKFTKKL